MLRRIVLSLVVSSVLGCAGVFGSPVAASQVLSLARELGTVLELVAGRVLGPKAPAAFGQLVADARRALEAIEHVSRGSDAALSPEEARRLFGRFLDAYESLWLALEAAGMLSPEGELLGAPTLGAVGERGELGSSVLGDGAVVPSPSDVETRIARRLGGER